VRSRWSAEALLTLLAVASMEGAWLTLVYVGLQWATHQTSLPLNVLHFALAVALGMFVARSMKDTTPTRFALVLGLTALVAAVVGAIISGTSAPDAGAYVRAFALSPATWLLGLAVIRGAVQADPQSGYGTEQVFSLGIPGLLIYWILASLSGLTHDAGYTTAAFTATLTFVTAGLLALGLSRLDDLQVESLDRAARSRWLVLLVTVIGAVLVIGVPLAALLGVPVSSAVAGVLGPLAPLVIALFGILAIPVFALLDLVNALLGPPHESALPTLAPPSGAGSAPPPLIDPNSIAPIDLTWLLIVALLVGFFVLVRVLAILLRQPALNTAANDVDEIRVSEEFRLPPLPRLPRLRLRARRPEPQTATQAYELALASVDGGPLGRRADETPREHARRIATDGSGGRDLAWLATDYQLDQFATRSITPAETRRAVGRWRRIVRAAKRS
jgi:hypothetical protein